MNRNYPLCDLYVPGHVVHWIQAKRSSDHPGSWGRLEEVSGQIITVRFSDRVARYRNHHAEALLDVAQTGARVRVSEPYRILRTYVENGDAQCFCIVDTAEPWRPCSVAETSPNSFEDLVDRLNDRGGFSVPGLQLTGIDQQRDPDD